MRITVTLGLGLLAAVAAGLRAAGAVDPGRAGLLVLAGLAALAAVVTLVRGRTADDRRRPRRRGDPRRAGGWRLVARIATGAATHTFLGHGRGGSRAAVTVLDRAYAGRPEARTRFARDVTARGAVPESAAPPLLGADPTARRPWAAVADVDAPSLADAVAAGGVWPVPAVWSLAAAVADALAAVHEAGTAHRGLTPATIRLTPAGVRLVEVGLTPVPDDITTVDPALVAYLAPEQLQGQRGGPAADLFALGSVLTFAATGRPPFGATASDQIRFHVTQQPADLSTLDGELRATVESCLAKLPGARPAATRVARTAHAHPAVDLPVPPRRSGRRRGRGILAAAAVALGGAVAATVVTLR